MLDLGGGGGGGGGGWGAANFAATIHCSMQLQLHGTSVNFGQQKDLLNSTKDIFNALLLGYAPWCH